MDGTLASTVNHRWATEYKENYKVNRGIEATVWEILSGTLSI